MYASNFKRTKAMPDQVDENIIPEVYYGSADEFYRGLNHELVGDFQPDPVTLFRGIWNADFDLIPSSRRPDGQSWLQQLGKDIHNNFEVGALSEFYRRANELGLGVPSVPSCIHQDLVDLFDQDKMSASATWPNSDVLEILALAQHHGLKTPLQDWSKSPLGEVGGCLLRALFDQRC